MGTPTGIDEADRPLLRLEECDGFSRIGLQLKATFALGLTLVCWATVGQQETWEGSAVVALFGGTGILLLLHALAGFARRAPSSAVSWMVFIAGTAGWFGAAAWLLIASRE